RPSGSAAEGSGTGRPRCSSARAIPSSGSIARLYTSRKHRRSPWYGRLQGVSTTIGLDVGGTKVSCAVMLDGHLSEPLLTPTVLQSSDTLIEQLVGIIAAAGAADAVGIGIPSVVDFEQGMAMTSVNIPLVNVPLRRILTERTGVPVFVDNDANVA